MTFAEPIWLFAGLFTCLALVWLYYRFDLRQRAALARFASGHLLGQLTASVSRGRRTFKRVLFIAGTACIFLALARPQWGSRWEEVHRKGIDILFAIDTSKSMLAQDVKPNRLTRAKLAVTDLVNKLDGDRVGLIAFAGDAFLQAPLTLDYDAFRQSLDAVDIGVVPRGGTNVAAAIQEASAAFGTETKNQKILVLLTDGEDLEAKGIDAARSAAKDGLKIYTIGIGGTGGELIPVADDNGGTSFLKDEKGEYVKSRLDESTLQQIAAATGATYAPLGQQGEGLETVYQHALAPLPKQDVMSHLQRVSIERFQWPLALGCVLLLAEMFIGTRKSRYGRHRFAPVPARRTQARLRQAVTALVLAMWTLAVTAQASPQAAESAYKKGDYTAAEKEYQQAAAKDPHAAALQFNLGAAAYKGGQYDKALPAFQNTLATDKLDVQQQAYYNLGNTQYRVGQKTAQTQPQETIKTWQSALASYDGALKLNANDADAKFNRDFVQKKLDELQKQQQQKQDQQSKDQQSKDQDSKDQQSKDQQSKDQQSKDQDSKDQQSKDQQSKDQQSKDQQSKDQQSKDQQSKDQQSKDQQSKDQQSKDQDSKDQQSKDQQDQAKGQDKQTPPQLAKNDQKPQPTPGDAQPEQTPQPTPGQSDQDAPAQPGEMSPQEAKALLDSVKKDEHVLPTAPDARNNDGQGQENPPAKDW